MNCMILRLLAIQPLVQLVLGLVPLKKSDKVVKLTINVLLVRK
jgi:hypothetical protein